MPRSIQLIIVSASISQNSRSWVLSGTPQKTRRKDIRSRFRFALGFQGKFHECQVGNSMSILQPNVACTLHYCWGTCLCDIKDTTILQLTSGLSQVLKHLFVGIKGSLTGGRVSPDHIWCSPYSLSQSYQRSSDKGYMIEIREHPSTKI